MVRTGRAVLVVLALLALPVLARAADETASRAEPVVTPEEQALLTQVRTRSRSDLRGAIEDLRKKTLPTSSAALDYTLGTLYAKADRNDDAEKAFLAATRKLPGFAQAWESIGRLRISADRPREAATALARAIELGEASVHNWKLLAYAHLASERYLAAESAYRTVLALAPEDEKARLGLIRSLLARGQTRAAVPLLEEQCAREPDVGDQWLLLANAHLELDEPDAALVVLETARRLADLPPEAFLTMGDLAYRKGLYDLATGYYGKAPQGDLSEERLLNCAEALHALGRNDDSARLLERIGEGGEHAARRHLLAGRLAAERGDVEAAVKSLSAALTADPLNGPAMLDLAQLFMSGKEIDRARIVLERAARLAPVREQALLTLVQLEVGAGEYDRAIEILVKALELRSDPRLEDYLAEIRRIAASSR